MMMQDGVILCAGCVHLTPASATGDGFRCTQLEVQQLDFVTGRMFAPRAQQVRTSGLCGRSAALYEPEQVGSDQ